MSKDKKGAQDATNEPEPTKTVHAGHEAHKNSIVKTPQNDKINVISVDGLKDYVEAAHAKIMNLPKAQGVRHDAQSPDWKRGGVCEALGMAVAQLKADDGQEARAEIIKGISADFQGDSRSLLLLESLAKRFSELPYEFGGIEDYPTLANVKHELGETSYAWEPYIMDGGLNAIAGDVGAGKTVFAMDLHRRQFKGSGWPDGKPIAEPGKKVVWVMADQRLGQLVEAAENMEVPLESIVIAAEKGRSTVPLTFDDQTSMGRLRQIVSDVRPWAVIVDTFTSAMGSREQSKPEVINPVTMHLLDIATTFKIPVILLCHTNAEGSIYGKALARKSEHQLSLVLSNRHDKSSPRNVHCLRSRRYEDTQSLGVIYDRRGYTYGQPHEEVEDSIRQAQPKGQKTDSDMGTLSLLLEASGKSGISLGVAAEAIKNDRSDDAAKKAAQRALERLRENGVAVNSEKQWYKAGQSPDGTEVSPY